MNLRRSLGPDLIPEIPNETAVGWLDNFRPHWREFRTVKQSLEEIPFYLKTVFWTERLFELVRLVRPALLHLVPGLRGVAIGYHDPEDEEFEGNSFGLIIYMADISERDYWKWRPTWSHHAVDLVDLFELALSIKDYSDYPARQELRSGLRDVLDLASSDRRRDGGFRAVVRTVTETVHSPGVHPDGGVSACYARSRVGTQDEKEGILTVKHVLSTPSLNAQVQMANGEPDHTVVDLAPDGIDAALISSDTAVPPGDLPIQPYPAQYLPVQIHTATKVKDNLVTAVTDTYNVWDSADIPAYLELEWPAKAGDSGSLVVDSVSGGAVGLYRGRHDSSHPKRTQGRAAHMRQVKALMELELHQ